MIEDRVLENILNTENDYKEPYCSMVLLSVPPSRPQNSLQPRRELQSYCKIYCVNSDAVSLQYSPDILR